MPEEQISYDQPYLEWQNKRAVDAISDIFLGKKLSKNSKKDYGLALDYFVEAATAMNLQDLKLKDIKKSTVVSIMDAYKEMREAPDKQYNKNFEYLRSLFNAACEYAEIESSPTRKIKKYDVVEGEGYIPPTDEEQAVIKEHLTAYHPHFYVLCSVVYHTGIRPNEALALRISDIDFKKRRFTIIPDDDRENAKTNSNRIVPINHHLWADLEKMQLWRFPADYFVFGSPAKAGRGNTGISIKDKSKYYTPFPTPVKRDTATRLWHDVVKVGLGFECDMYGLKHKGAQDKEDAGMSDDAVQHLFGHSSKRMTRKYKADVPYEKEIREKSPAF